MLVTDPSWVSLFHSEYRSKYALGDETLRRPSRLAARAPSGKRRRCIGVKRAKWFASWVWDCLSRDQCRRVMRGLRRADGCEKTPVNRIFTSSTTFRDEVVRLCLHAGYAPRFGRLYEAGTSRGISRSGQPIVATSDAWYVSYADGERNGAYSRPVVRRASDVRAVSYSGRTWCVSVPHNYVITRRARADDTGEVTMASAPVIVHNCLISHGASQLILDRLLDNSDPSLLTVCGKCGLPAQPAAEHTSIRNRQSTCQNCKSNHMVKQMHTPYSFRLLLQELQAMNIAVRFDF